MNSLRKTLIVRLLCGGVLLLGAAGVLLDWQVRRALTNEFDASLRASVQALTMFVEHKADGVKVEREGASMPQFEQADASEIFLLRLADGRELQRSRSLGNATLPLQAGPADTPTFFDAGLPNGRMLRCAGIRLFPKMARKAREQNTPATEIVLSVGRDRSALDRTVATVRTALAFAGATALAGFIILVNLGVRSGLTPLDHLGQTVASVEASSLATRLPIETMPSELQPIALRLNELLERLERAFERERRFTATAAHELRTPLAELRALAEVNLTTPATDDERPESWRDALGVTLRMETLALRLLELTRSENPAHAIRHEPVLLKDAITDAWRPWASRAAEHDRALDLSVPEGLTAQTDPALLGIILGNLCGNAAEHAPPGSPVRVSARQESRAINLYFSNRAGDLTEKDIPHLFERLWRKDSARTDSRHHGLGLAVAKEFAALLGGSLTAHLNNGDIAFELRLPVG